MTTDSPEGMFAGIPCRDCGEASLELEIREEWIAQHPATYSLAGVQRKLSTQKQDRPWCVCRNCGAESRGKLA